MFSNATIVRELITAPNQSIFCMYAISKLSAITRWKNAIIMISLRQNDVNEKFKNCIEMYYYLILFLMNNTRTDRLTNFLIP